MADTYNDGFVINGLDYSIHTNLLFTVYQMGYTFVYLQFGYSSDKVLWDGRVADLDNQYCF